MPFPVRRRASAFVVLALPLVLAACAKNPVSGRTELTLVSAERERELGREEAAKVEATMGLVRDPQLAAYVREVGERVAKHSPLAVPYSFAVVDTPEPNAFALPGGYVYVSRGLLALMNGEDELAGVMGHEVGHVAARHAVQRVSRAAPIAIVSGLGAAVTGAVSPMLGSVVGGIGSVTNELILAPYGRDQEREADQVGAKLAAEAGFDPAALAAALRALEREEALGRERRADRPSFFATHPPLPERVETVRALAATLPRAPGTPIASTREAFLERLDGLVIGKSAAEGVFQGATFVHPDLDVAITFPKGWKTSNAREAVGASDAAGAAMLLMDVAGSGDDPVRPFAEMDAKRGSDLAGRAEPFDAGGRRAAHVTTQARTEDGPLVLDITCVAHGGRIFRIVGVTRPSHAGRMGPVFRAAARSFHTPSTAERAAVREARLRLARARDGETIAGLVARTRSTWAADMVAVANALEPGARLRGGQVLKVAVEEPYPPRR